MFSELKELSQIPGFQCSTIQKLVKHLDNVHPELQRSYGRLVIDLIGSDDPALVSMDANNFQAEWTKFKDFFGIEIGYVFGRSDDLKESNILGQDGIRTYGAVFREIAESGGENWIYQMSPLEADDAMRDVLQYISNWNAKNATAGKALVYKIPDNFGKYEGHTEAELLAIKGFLDRQSDGNLFYGKIVIVF